MLDVRKRIQNSDSKEGKNEEKNVGNGSDLCSSVFHDGFTFVLWC
jgi:hypothetical protein